MNASELIKLNSKSLSHIARSLYILLLRNKAEQKKNIIDLVEIADFLYTDSQNFKTTASLEIAVLVLDELEKNGLIEKQSVSNQAENNDIPWQGCTFTLPLFIQDNDTLPSVPFSMNTSWRPGSTFAQSCILCGLSDPSFTQGELTAFTSYWAGRHEMRNQTAWERAFALRLLKSRTALVKKAKKTADEQLSQRSTVSDPAANVHITSESVKENCCSESMNCVENSQTDSSDRKDNSDADSIKNEQIQLQNELSALFSKD
ncbi:MAG: DnaT-like ssDNA-binding domain-containing protein [Succinivibrio sp.]